MSEQSEPTSRSERKPDPLFTVRSLLADGKLEQSLAALKTHWLENPNDQQATELFAEVTKEAGRPEVSKKLMHLAEVLKNPPEQPQGTKNGEQNALSQAFFEAGFGLIDLRQFELAIMLLLRCYKDYPDDPVINYELGFSLMSLARWEEAIAYFLRARKKANDFDTNLNLAVCYTLTRKLNEAKRTLDDLGRFATAEDERKELAHRKIVLKRMEGFGKRANFTPRDWLYILYGSVLLRPNEPAKTEDQHKTIASALLILRGLLEGLRVEVEVIEYYNPLSRPLAKLLAELMELPVDSYKGPDRPERALLVMAWATDIIGPHQVFVEQSERRRIFSYGLDWREPLPIAPDIVACMAGECAMPWDEGTRTAKVDDILAKLTDKARDMESDPEIIKAIQDSVEYYDQRREWIVLGNHESFPERPEYTAEIPQ